MLYEWCNQKGEKSEKYQKSCGEREDRKRRRRGKGVTRTGREYDGMKECGAFIKGEGVGR